MRAHSVFGVSSMPFRRPRNRGALRAGVVTEAQLRESREAPVARRGSTWRTSGESWLTDMLFRYPTKSMGLRCTPYNRNGSLFPPRTRLKSQPMSPSSKSPADEPFAESSAPPEVRRIAAELLPTFYDQLKNIAQ